MDKRNWSYWCILFDILSDNKNPGIKANYLSVCGFGCCNRWWWWHQRYRLTTKSFFGTVKRIEFIIWTTIARITLVAIKIKFNHIVFNRTPFFYSWAIGPQMYIKKIMVNLVLKMVWFFLWISTWKLVNFCPNLGNFFFK